MSEPKPYYRTTEPDPDWHEQAARRFDGTLPADVFAARPITITPRPLPVFSTPAIEPTPPLDIADMEYFQTEYDERAAAIVEAAADAAPDIETVFRHWGYTPTHPLPNLRALLDLLKPPYVKPPPNST